METQKNVKNENLQSHEDLQLRYRIGAFVNLDGSDEDLFIVECSCFYLHDAKKIYKTIYKPQSNDYILYDAYRRIFIDVN